MFSWFKRISRNRYKTETKPYFCVQLKNHKKVFIFKHFCNQWLPHYQPNVYGFSIGPDLYKKTTQLIHNSFFKKYICSSLFRTDYCCCFNWKKIVIPTRNAWCYNRLLKIRINFSMTYSSWDTLNFICFLKYIM